MKIFKVKSPKGHADFFTTAKDEVSAIKNCVDYLCWMGDKYSNSEFTAELTEIEKLVVDKGAETCGFGTRLGIVTMSTAYNNSDSPRVLLLTDEVFNMSNLLRFGFHSSLTIGEQSSAEYKNIEITNDYYVLFNKSDDCVEVIDPNI